jgi:predicted DNA-binding protein
MYVYIVQRTQIYLDDQENRVLRRIAKSSGKTKSQLIREAIIRVYLVEPHADETLSALRDSAGAWRRRETGEKYVERLRKGRLAALHRVAR